MVFGPISAGVPVRGHGGSAIPAGATADLADDGRVICHVFT